MTWLLKSYYNKKQNFHKATMCLLAKIPFLSYNRKRMSNETVQLKLYQISTPFHVAGETRFEHATYGFGDRYSTIEPLP